MSKLENKKPQDHLLGKAYETKCQWRTWCLSSMDIRGPWRKHHKEMRSLPRGAWSQILLWVQVDVPVCREPETAEGWGGRRRRENLEFEKFRLNKVFSLKESHLSIFMSSNIVSSLNIFFSCVFKNITKVFQYCCIAYLLTEVVRILSKIWVTRSTVQGWDHPCRKPTNPQPTLRPLLPVLTGPRPEAAGTPNGSLDALWDLVRISNRRKCPHRDTIKSS